MNVLSRQVARINVVADVLLAFDNMLCYERIELALLVIMGYLEVHENLIYIDLLLTFFPCFNKSS